MKRLNSILTFFVVFFLMSSAVYAQGRPALPKLSFADARLQQFATLADEQYNEADACFIFEDSPEKWEGKSLQRMMLAYFLTVNNVLNMPDENGAAKYDFSAAEAEQVQTAMLKKYFDARKLQVPSDFAKRFDFVESQVKALEADAEYLGDGPQMSLNHLAEIGAVLSHYLELRLSREICDKLGVSEIQGFVSAESNLYEVFYENLSDSHGKYLLLTNGGGSYYSMWSLEVSGFKQKMLNQRIISLKRLATSLNISGFKVPALSMANADEKITVLSKKMHDYLNFLESADVKDKKLLNEAKSVFKTSVTAFSDFMQSRKDLGDYIPDKRYVTQMSEMPEYIQILIDAHSSEEIE